MAAERFTIKIPCKPYLKAFLEINCGDPVDLRYLPDLLEEFKRGLSRKPEHREKTNVVLYKDFVTIIIPSDMFYRYGWEMNKENLLDFNRAVERLVKFFMRQYIAVNSSLGLSVTKCIREFQNRFGFDESIWNFEALKKDWDRNGTKIELKSVKQLQGELNKILLANLSDIGTISKKLKKEYSNG